MNLLKFDTSKKGYLGIHLFLTALEVDSLLTKLLSYKKVTLSKKTELKLCLDVVGGGQKVESEFKKIRVVVGRSDNLIIRRDEVELILAEESFDIFSEDLKKLIQSGGDFRCRVKLNEVLWLWLIC